MRKRKSFLQSLVNDSDGWGGYTLRQVIPASQLSLSGTKLSLRLAAKSGSTVNIASCWVGQAATDGAGNINYIGTPTQVKFNDGSASVAIPASSVKDSDIIDFTLDEAHDLVISLYVSSGSTQNFRALTTLSGAVAKQKSGDYADDTGDVNTLGWTTLTPAVVAVAAVLVAETGIQLYDDVMPASSIKGAWGLRKLVSGYAGSLVRIRDTNDNTEQDVGFDANGNLNSFTVVGTARVVKVYDQSGGDDLVQATTSKQPTLLTSGTPRGKPAIDFDPANGEHLYGATAGTARPYMVANPVMLFGFGGGATSASYASIVKIANADGNNNSPYFRLALERNSSTDLMRLGINGSNYSDIDFNEYASVTAGWMTLVASCVTGEAYAGVKSTPAQPFNTTDVTYPNSTRIFVAANGAGGENWGGYFTELGIFDNVELDAVEWRRFAGDIRVKTMVSASNGKEWRLMFSDNFYAGSDNSISFSTIEFHSTAGGADTLPASGTGVKSFPRASYSTTENGPKIFDDNNSTQWSSDNLGSGVVVGFNFNLPAALLPVEITFKARGDAYYYLAPKVFTIECLYNDEWVSRGSFDLTASGNAASQVYTMTLTPLGSLDSVTPNAGGTSGGTLVTLSGSGFTTATDVQFDGDSATSITVVDDYTITCYTPAHAVGAVTVTIVRPTTNITLASGYNYSVIPAPSVTSITPDTGLTQGGYTVTIVGDNFTSTSAVDFGVFTATDLVIVDDETITCTVPADIEGTVDVTLYNPNGNTTVTDGFTYVVYSEVTQIPLLIVHVSELPASITQIPLLVVNLPIQGAKITQEPSLALYTPTPIPLPLPILPDVPITETWEWNTIITVSENGKEQRSSLRKHPRLNMRFDAILLDDTDRRDAYLMLFKYLKEVFDYPLYPYMVKLAASAAIGDTKLYFTPSNTDMRDGEKLAIFAPDLSLSIILDISTVDVDGATLSAPLTFDVASNWLVCPTSRFITKATIGLQMNAIDGSFSLDLRGTSLRQITRPGQSTTLTTIDGYPILDKRPLSDNEVDEEFDQNAVWLDNEINTPVVFTNWPYPLVSGSRKYLAHRPADMDYWRAFGLTVRGRQNPFLLPTFRDDLPLIEVPALGDSVLVSSNVQFFDFWRSATYRYLRIASDAGVIYRKVQEVIANYDANGQPVSIDIILADNIGAGVGANTNLLVSYANMVRLDSDKIELEHGYMDTYVSLKVMGIYQ